MRGIWTPHRIIGATGIVLALGLTFLNLFVTPVPFVHVIVPAIMFPAIFISAMMKERSEVRARQAWARREAMETSLDERVR